MQKISKLNLGADQMEIQPRGTPEFPISVYSSKLSEYMLGFLELHWHNDIQFTYVTDGICQFQVNQLTVELSDGMGIFINSGCLHMAKPI